MITGACALLLAINTAVAASPLPYEAEYGVYRNNKLIARATVKLEQTGDHKYRYSRQSEGSRGLAALLNVSDSETAEFEYLDGAYRPNSYQTKNRVAGRKRGWHADFDWQQNKITGIKDGESFELETEPGLQDPGSFRLTLHDALSEGLQSLEVRMLDGAEIDDRKFSFNVANGFTTSIGCTDTVRVDRIRVNSKRYTTSWHAPSAGYTLVRLDHGKRGDKTNSMRLERLTIDGETVTFDEPCSTPDQD